MKKKIILLWVIMSLCVCILGDGASAKEKQFQRQDTNYKYNEDRDFDKTAMYLANDGKVHYVWLDIDYDKKNDEYHTVFHRNAIDGKKIKKMCTFKDKPFDLYRDIRVQDNKTLTIRQNDKDRLIIKEFDKNGKNIFTYKEKKNIQFDKIYGWDDGKNIYYTTKIDGNPYVINTRCINKKSKKAKNIGSFKLLGMTSEVPLRRMQYSIKVENGQIYVLSDKEINVYSFKGKLLNTCNLPDGEKLIRISDDPIDDPELVNYLSIDKFTVFGKFVYYCNRNGIYRWNMKGKDGFKLYYNAEGDEYFNTEYGLSDICVKDENTIYMMFHSMINYELGISKIVRYRRK